MTNSDYGVVFAGCTEPGYDLLRYVNEELVQVDEIITLTPKQGKEYNVGKYYSCQSYAEKHGISVYTPTNYEMSHKKDKSHFRNNPEDLMIVHGWQRLIPSEILQTFEQGTLGLHGSAFGLPKGRGRSPMNWSLLEDLDRFILSVMLLDEGADSGGVVSSKKFNINEFDTIKTMYHKLIVAAQQMFDDILLDGLKLGFEPQSQSGEPTYYPKRIPDDGAIDWEDPTKTIYNLTRAVTDPYPGAFTEYTGNKVYLWDVQPFSPDFLFDAQPGTILQVFTPDEDFVVKTSDGSLLVTAWEAEGWKPQKGMKFTSLQNESIDSPNRMDRPEHEDQLTSN
jgi:methionyl-tRNA formyltransferase